MSIKQNVTQRTLNDLLAAIISAARQNERIRLELVDLNEWNGVAADGSTTDDDVLDARHALEDIDRAHRTLTRIARTWGAS